MRAGASRTLGSEQIGEVLGEWQQRELRIARSFRECSGLSAEQLEDLYQETAIALLRRRYATEEHLRNALRTGLRHRALNLHRDERRRTEILTHGAPEIRVLAHADGGEDAERTALIHEDRLIVTEFLTELNQTEQHVFALLAEGMGYRAIAPVVGIEVNEARNASRSCERKRERFQLLYDTGRLCGFRAGTIEALQNGQATSEELAQRALAHLESCPHCRAEHKTNARRLRRSFEDRAAGLLPLGALLNHFSWLARADVRVRTMQQRLIGDGVPLGQGGVRERVIGLLAGGGASAKVAAAVVTVTVVAGGTIGATRVLEHGGTHHRRAASDSAAPRAQSRSGGPIGEGPLSLLARPNRHQVQRAAADKRSSSPGHASLGVPRVSQQAHSAQREPGGFAYLGVPTGASTPTSAPAPAHTAARSGGGLFSP